MTFSLPKAGRIKAVVYNSLGQQVCDIADAYFEAGEHVFEWNGKNDGQADVASGVYFLRVTAPDFSASQKMMLVR